jgi:murein DD-endopeptidase MepM/ murein hydrolase activator NlpD
LMPERRTVAGSLAKALEKLSAPGSLVIGAVSIGTATLVGITLPLYFRLAESQKELAAAREQKVDLVARGKSMPFEDRKKMLDLVTTACEVADKAAIVRRFTQLNAVFHEFGMDERLCGFDQKRLFAVSREDLLLLLPKGSDRQKQYSSYLKVIVPVSKDVLDGMLASYELIANSEQIDTLDAIEKLLGQQGIHVSSNRTPQIRVFETIEPSSESASPPSGLFKGRWPVLNGRIVSRFGPATNGINDGLNIAVPLDTDVIAAMEGEVAYAGSELRSYGNLVLIRHASGHVTAYAHLRKISVSKGATVEAGEIIGKVGSTGNVTTPQLHFEIRDRYVPVDPEALLGRY